MTGESRSMEQNVLERSGLMKDFLSEKINGLKRERLKEIREKFVTSQKPMSFMWASIRENLL